LSNSEDFLKAVKSFDSSDRRYEFLPKEKKLDVGGVFVEVGSLPNIDFIKDLVKIDDYGQIVTDARTQKTSLEGIWAAGDVTDVLYKQNNISVGDAIRGVLNVFDYLHKK